MKRSALRQIIISGCIAVGASIGVNPANANRATVLHTFKGKFDGLYPQSVLVEDQLGNIYGTTSGDLDYNGTVFKLSPDGKETVLHKFGSDGRKWALSRRRCATQPWRTGQDETTNWILIVHRASGSQFCLVEPKRKFAQ